MELIRPILGLPTGMTILIVIVVILLLFGGRKIPEMMRGIGKGIRSFKEGMKDINEEIKKDSDASADDKK